jgi:hypothetical protein
MEETLILLCKEEEKKGVDLELPLPYIFLLVDTYLASTYLTLLFV